MTPIARNTGVIRPLEITNNEKDWFKGIVLSATFLERYGYLKLKEYFASKRIKLDKALERLHLRQIALYLYELEEINKTQYDIMVEINIEGNNAVHQKKDRTFFFTSEAEKKYKPLIEKAIKCLRVLGVEKFVVMK